MFKNLEEFDFESFENDILYEKLSLLKESNHPFGLDYEKQVKIYI